MKHTLIILFLSGLSNFTFSQKGIDHNDFQPIVYTPRVVLYKDIDNQFFYNAWMPMEKWVVKCSNGTVDKFSSGMLNIKPTEIGVDTVFFFYNTKENEQKLKFSITLNVEKLPNTQLDLGKNNIIKIKELLKINEFKIKGVNLQYFLKYNLTSCKILLIQENGLRKEYLQNGGIIADDLRKIFYNLKKNDILIFNEIKVKRENSTEIENADGLFLRIED